MPYELVIPDPIGKVFHLCEVYCVAACCQHQRDELRSGGNSRTLWQMTPCSFVRAVAQECRRRSATSEIDSKRAPTHETQAKLTSDWA